jgi:PAS domain S-box-containing protein
LTQDVVPQQLRLLVVEDSDDDYQILVRELAKAGYLPRSERVTSAAELTSALGRSWDLMVTDWMLPGFGGLQALDMLAARDVDLPCIVISGTPNEEAAVSALRAGALDFLSKDRPLRFVPAIERALRESAVRRARLVAERELRLSEARYRMAFEHAPEPLLTYDLAQGRVLEANRAAQKLLGRTVEELRATSIGGLSPEKLTDGSDAVEIGRTLITRLLEGSELLSHDWELVGRDGEVIPVELRLARMPSDQAQLLRVTILDQRERLRTEEVRRRAAELELQNRRIQEASRLKSEFLANMSHELRTPLNAIIGFAELLHDGQVPHDTPQHKEFLGDILTSGRHLLQLINDVLDLAKVEAGKLDFRPERVDLGKLVGEVVSITRTTASKKKITVETTVDPSLVDITIDPNRFKQVAYNYLSNALKFTPERGRVAIRVVPDGPERFRLELQDTGVGIASEDIGRLFVEFQQLESGASKRHQGTGLGLALTRRLVEAQGGAVGVSSAPGKGSTFHATLPRSVRGGEAMLVTPTSTPRLGARTVLVVEDTVLDRELLVETLARAGYAVETATTGAEAIARCKERSFDAVTLDLMLPDMSGLDLLASLRTNGRARQTPVIVVTVAADHRLIAAFAVHDVIEKPLEPATLLHALERAGVRPDRRGGILVVDDDPGALRLMDATLAQLGYSTITRSTGAAALEAAVQLHPSAVVLDLVMDGMDGVEFLDKLRQLPEHARTPVLVWTMKDLTDAEAVRLRQAAQAVVSKNGTTPASVVQQLKSLLPGGVR